MSNPNEIAAQLKIVWAAEICLFDRIREFDFLTQHDDSSSSQNRETLPEILAALSQQSGNSKRLLKAWNQLGLKLDDELARLRTKRDKTLQEAMEVVLQTQKAANASKHEVLTQLASVNQAQAGYDRYSKS